VAKACGEEQRYNSGWSGSGHQPEKFLGDFFFPREGSCFVIVILLTWHCSEQLELLGWECFVQPPSTQAQFVNHACIQYILYIHTHIQSRIHIFTYTCNAFFSFVSILFNVTPLYGIFFCVKNSLNFLYFIRLCLGITLKIRRVEMISIFKLNGDCLLISGSLLPFQHTSIWRLPLSLTCSSVQLKLYAFMLVL